MTILIPCLVLQAAPNDEPTSPSDQLVPKVVEQPLPSENAEVADAITQAEECCCPRYFSTKYTVFFTQTTDYGTGLALPIGLTPLNTLITPAGIPGATAIPTTASLGPLGLLDNFGVVPGPIADTPVKPVFPSDFQFQTTAGLLRTTKIGDKDTFTVGYTYYENLHPRVQQLNLQSHTLTALYAHQIDDRTTRTLDYAYSYYFLDGASFVDQNRIGTSLVRKVNTQFDLLARADYSRANFQPAPFLNSDNYSAKLEGYRYLTADHTDYISAGYSAGYSDAAIQSVSYQVNSIYAVGRWLYGENNTKEIRLTVSYNNYDFASTDSIQTGVHRVDNIYIGNLYLGRKIADNTQFFALYNFLGSTSTVIRNQYDSNLVSFGISYRR